MTAVLFGDSRLPNRFWVKVYPEPNTGCWLWAGYIGPQDGYGQIRVEGKTLKVHKWMYDTLFGLAPKGIEIDHLCRVRWCVNPDHMERVTKAENIARGEWPSAIHARQTHCKYGHELTGDNVKIYSYPTSTKRVCQSCARRRSLERHPAARAREVAFA